MTARPPSTTALRVAGLDWAALGAELDREGCVAVPDLLDDDALREIAALPASPDATHALETLALGRGELRRLDTLPAVLAEIRAAFHERLVPLADAWNERLGMPGRYPPALHDVLAENARSQTAPASSSLVHLRAGDHLALHQRDGGAGSFPFQLVALLSAPDDDFTGGEFVLTEQRPRMQSRPIVLPLRRGDAAIIATGRRPHRGSKGDYRVSLKHAVGRVRSGERIGLELMLHDGAAA